MTDNFVSGNRSEKYWEVSYTSFVAQWLTASYDLSKCKQSLKLPFVLRSIPFAFFLFKMKWPFMNTSQLLWFVISMVFTSSRSIRVGRGGISPSAGGMSVFFLLNNTRIKWPKYLLGYDGQHLRSIKQRTHCSGVYMPWQLTWGWWASRTSDV